MPLVSTLFGLISSLAVAGLLVAGYFAHVTRRISRDAEHRVPPCGGFITIDGCRVHYIDEGSGLPIVMIHGLGGHLHHMRRPLMQSFGQGYRLIALDRPGSGYSTRPRGMTGRLPEQARLVRRFIEELGLERPLLVGHSLGGAIALAIALDHPETISGLALISPLTRNDGQLPAEFSALAIRSPLRRRLVAHTLAVPMSVKNAPQALELVFGPQKPPADYAVAGGALVGLRPSHFYATSTDLVAVEHDMSSYEARLGELDMPVGILFGTADRVIDHRRHGIEMRDLIPGLDLELLEGVGHMPQYSETQRVVAFIRRIAGRAFADRRSSAPIA